MIGIERLGLAARRHGAALAVATVAALAATGALAQAPPSPPTQAPNGGQTPSNPATPANQNTGQHEDNEPVRQSWTFSGVFGGYDQAQLQRGFQVWRQVCSNCHALSIPFRTLGDAGGPHFSEGQVKALAAEYKVQDGPNDRGEMFERPARPSDDIPWIFANEQAARANFNGALPPNMNLLAKARTYERGFPLFIVDALPFFSYEEQGPDYIASLLQGYEAPPPGFTLNPGQYYNKYMPGHRLAMAKPLEDNAVDYADGSPKTLHQYALDVASFLMWAAEPKLEARKRIGFRVIVFLAVFAGLLLYVKKRIWAGLHDGEMRA